MEERRVDLHIHTYYSDGTYSPDEAVKLAKDLNLAAIAICDHDCIDGLEEAHRAGVKYGLEVVPAVEVTCEKDNIEVHILGYYINIDAGSIMGLLNKLRLSRIERIYNMIDKLKSYSINISPEVVFSLSQRGTIGRLHLAMALQKEGFVSSIKEAFIKYIGDQSPCYVRRFNVTPKEAIKAIIESEGVPVYAHPKVMGRDDFIPEFIKAGLCGIEVYHSDHTKAVSQHYLMLARKYGLLVTGGSDCHGLGKEKILMGRVTMPYSTLLELKRESYNIQKRNSRL